MKLRLAAIALILVGVGSVGLVLVGPTFGGSSTSQYITASVSLGTVTQSSVATGSVAASTVYGLKFGVNPDIVSSASTTSGTGGSVSNNTGSSSSGSGTLVWPVKTVAVKVGQKVSKGDVLATADSTAAQLALTSAQATLDAAQSRYTTDQTPDSLTVAQAKNSLSQSYNSYKQAVANRDNTNAQNALTLQQAQDAVTAAQNQLATDQAASPPVAQSVLDKDNANLATAQQNLASTQLKVNQSNQQADQSVTNASLSYQAAQLSYQSKTAPAADSTLLADQAAVASAQATVDADQAAVTAATMTAPADGLIIAVNLLPGVNAPTGYAIEESVGPLVAVASFSESDVTKLKVGQAATVAVNAASTSVAGVLTQIVPAATGGTSGGQQSSVVTYAVTVTLTDPPETVFAGMTASITVTTASVDNVVRIPATALSGDSTNGYTVQVVNGNNVTTADVKVGLVTSTYAEIQSGLSQGQAVVTGSVSSRNGTTTAGGGVNLSGLTGGGLSGGGFGR
jgi:macrolide-specific efflux system membrane fusion protein